MGDTLLENGVRLEADGVEEIFGFQKSVDTRCRKGGIPSEVAVQVPFTVSLNDRYQNIAPTIGAVDIARAQGTPFQIAKLVEQE